MLAAVADNPDTESLRLPPLLPRGDGLQGVGGEGGEEGGDHVVQEGSLVLDRVDPSLLGPSSIHSLLQGRGNQEVGGRGFTLDTSLERVFGRGATMLAIEFEGMSEGGTIASLDDSSSESEKEMSVSTPARDELRKKRDRTGTSVSFGNLSGISRVGASHELSSSEGEQFEDGGNEVKKQRFASGNHGDESK